MGKQRPWRSTRDKAKDLEGHVERGARRLPTWQGKPPSLWGGQRRPEDSVEGLGSAHALPPARRGP